MIRYARWIALLLALGVMQAEEDVQAVRQLLFGRASFIAALGLIAIGMVALYVRRGRATSSAA